MECPESWGRREEWLEQVRRLRWEDSGRTWIWFGHEVRMRQWVEAEDLEDAKTGRPCCHKV